ncbi:MAG: hypothetical protein NVS4B5_14620 [Vulcanimicrobiaceae bacterium]
MISGFFKRSSILIPSARRPADLVRKRPKYSAAVKSEAKYRASPHVRRLRRRIPSVGRGGARHATVASVRGHVRASTHALARRARVHENTSLAKRRTVPSRCEFSFAYEVFAPSRLLWPRNENVIDRARVDI